MLERDPRAVEWCGDARSGALILLDQRVLPEREERLEFRTVEEVARAIRDMVVRGAPAIGVAAAYGMVLAARQARSADDLERSRMLVAATRPTAVNLFWALEKVRAMSDPTPESLLKLARAIHEQDIAGNARMAATGAARIEKGMGVLTHCNAGALATGGIGTALGVIARAHLNGKQIHVYVDETRPRLQGARLTAWELSRLEVPYTLICDNMAASLMRRGKIQFCVTGADRIALNGDVANKIGTYSVAVNARHHRVPFHVAAPLSTFDPAIPEGSHIPIEERDAGEVTDWGMGRTCPMDAKVLNPAFDVTPAELVTSIFTDEGEIAPVAGEGVMRLLNVHRGPPIPTG
ncbi:MAG: S-methyl-5-thioribose-1-phosphate isomerase [Myxococcaceae bacterium]